MSGESRFGSEASVRSKEAVVAVDGLTRKFGAKFALREVNLTIPRGSVFGLVGVNGAGKTTLIKHLLGLYKAQQGSVRVFELDPVLDPVGVLSKVGYLSEDNDIPEWMKVGELVRYVQAFYPGWDEVYAEELREMFELDPTAKIKNLSKGQRARAGLLVALAYRPELLVLDEPSAGLDPLVRRDILAAVIRTIADEGRTVLFSSHLLDEVERVSDQVAMIHEGEILFQAELDELKTRFLRVTLRFPEERSQLPRIDGAKHWEGEGREWSSVCTGPLESIQKAAAESGATVVESRAPTLDEIFVARAGR